MDDRRDAAGEREGMPLREPLKFCPDCLGSLPCPPGYVKAERCAQHEATLASLAQPDGETDLRPIPGFAMPPSDVLEQIKALRSPPPTGEEALTQLLVNLTEAGRRWGWAHGHGRDPHSESPAPFYVSEAEEALRLHVAALAARAVEADNRSEEFRQGEARCSEAYNDLKAEVQRLQAALRQSEALACLVPLDVATRVLATFADSKGATP